MNIQYNTYTVADVRAWLYKGVQNGLSEQVISKVRANAIIHNPYVEDEMVIVVSATDGDKVVGYTAMFPDYLVRPNVKLTCPTTLYAHPDYADEFIGYNVTKLLHDTANGRMVIGSDIAKESALIDKLLGLKVEKIERKRYIFNRTIEIHTLRNLASWIIEPYRKFRQKKSIKSMLGEISSTLHVEYTNFIDTEAYQFITAHSENDLFLRTQETLNWFIHYPFRVSAPLKHRLKTKTAFSSQSDISDYTVVKVYLKEEIVGIFMLAKRGNDIYVLMLYYEVGFANDVFAILLEQVLFSHPYQFKSHYKALNSFIELHSLFLKSYKEQFLFTHPNELSFNPNLQIQGMDGDMFV